MKKQLNVLLLLLLCVLCSCSLDTDDNSPEKMYVAFATVENPNATPKFYLLLDDNTKLYTAETGELANPDQGYPQNGRRVFVSYEALEPATANNIKLRNLVYVPVNGIATGNTTGRNDRYRLEMLYPGGTDFLNVLISHSFPTSSGNKHDILLIKKEYQEDAAYFDLIYSNNENPGYDVIMSPICFDLSPLKENYPDSIKLVINTYAEGVESPKTYTMKYKWQ